MSKDEAIKILEGFIKANDEAMENSFHSAVMEETVKKNIEAFQMAVECMKEKE